MDYSYKIARDRLGSDNGFYQANNFKLVDISLGKCTLEGVLTKSSFNPYELVHGGYIFGLADTAAGAAAATYGKVCVTLNASINYMRAIKKSVPKIFAKAEVIKAGKNTAVVNVDVLDDNDQVMASSTMTYYYLDEKI